METSEGIKIYQIETMDHKTLVMGKNTKDAVIKFFRGIQNLRVWVETNKMGGAIVVRYNGEEIAMSTIPILLNLRALDKKEAIAYLLGNTSMNPNIVDSYINTEMLKYKWIVEDD